MILSILTQPYTNMPVSLDEMKAHLRVTSTNDDDFISSLVLAAASYVEKATGQTTIQTQYQLTLSDWCIEYPGATWVPTYGSPYGQYFYGPDPALTSRGEMLKVKLPRFPLVSIDSFTVDAAAKTDYGILSTAPAVLRVHTTPRPVAYEGGIIIQFTAGYAAREGVPATLKAAIKLIVGLWYRNREAATDKPLSEMPMGICSLLDIESYNQVG